MPLAVLGPIFSFNLTQDIEFHLPPRKRGPDVASPGCTASGVSNLFAPLSALPCRGQRTSVRRRRLVSRTDTATAQLHRGGFTARRCVGRCQSLPRYRLRWLAPTTASSTVAAGRRASLIADRGTRPEHCRGRCPRPVDFFRPRIGEPQSAFQTRRGKRR
jgi:hypothetical protein